MTATRHPSTAWRPNLERCRERLAEVLCEEEAAWPELGAAVLTERGQTGLGVQAWAEAVGVPSAVVVAAESGALPVDAWPARLRIAVQSTQDEWLSAAACAPLLAAEIGEERKPGAEKGERQPRPPAR